jgi:hypothetical protein
VSRILEGGNLGLRSPATKQQADDEEGCADEQENHQERGHPFTEAEMRKQRGQSNARGQPGQGA